jgi:hypothetical protein
MTRSGKAKPAKLVAYNIPEIPRNQQLALLLDVEIVTVYKRTSEGFTIEAGKVKHTRNLLLHCAADEMKRNFLLSKK